MYQLSLRLRKNLWDVSMDVRVLAITIVMVAHILVPWDVLILAIIIVGVVVKVLV